MWQPGAAQATAFQQAVDVIAERVGEPSLRIDASVPDPPATFVERARNLPPAKRKAVMIELLNLALETLRDAEALPNTGALANAVQVTIYVLHAYALLLVFQEDA
jgi:hypothetical protein